ncbi:MAG: hypothetical protein ACREUE_01760, partial [Panacagrimonas sp.]
MNGVRSRWVLSRVSGLALLLTAPLCWCANPVDPLRSPAWDAMVARHLDGGTVVFDDRVQVRMPPSAEDALAVPVEVQVIGIGKVQEIRLIA